MKGAEAQEGKEKIEVAAERNLGGSEIMSQSDQWDFSRYKISFC